MLHRLSPQQINESKQGGLSNLYAHLVVGIGFGMRPGLHLPQTKVLEYFLYDFRLFYDAYHPHPRGALWTR
jgi:hypothetical protein